MPKVRYSSDRDKGTRWGTRSKSRLRARGVYIGMTMAIVIPTKLGRSGGMPPRDTFMRISFHAAMRLFGHERVCEFRANNKPGSLMRRVSTCAIYHLRDCRDFVGSNAPFVGNINSGLFYKSIRKRLVMIKKRMSEFLSFRSSDRSRGNP